MLFPSSSPGRVVLTWPMERSTESTTFWTLSSVSSIHLLGIIVVSREWIGATVGADGGAEGGGGVGRSGESSGVGEGGSSSSSTTYSSSGGMSERWRGVVARGGAGVVLLSASASSGAKGMRVRLPASRTLTRTG